MRIGFLFALILVVSPVFSHEFWIEPRTYQVGPGAPLVADFKNGEEFDGVTLGYFDRSSARLQMVVGGEPVDLKPRNGDLPALELTAPKDKGLVVLVHETTASNLTYRDWEKFAKFAAHKNFPDIEERHQSRGLPREDFVESYTRYAKTLISVGDGRGADIATGMKTEFVALTNPYVSDFDGTFRAKVYFEGDARRDAQVEVFDRAPDGNVKISLTRTDDNGEVTVPVSAGHTYLLDAVVLRPVSGDGKAVWDTLWAAMTFAVPE